MSRLALFGVFGVAALAGAGVTALYLSRTGRPRLPGAAGPALPGPVPGAHPLAPGAAIAASTRRLAATVAGAAYSYGGGTPGSAWPQGSAGLRGGKGWDCSGLILAWSAALLRYRWDGADLTSSQIANLCTPVELGRQLPGDLAAYRNRHVTAVVGLAGARGHSAVLSASGGGQSTNGDDPRAFVRLHDAADYRADFLTYMRLPPVEVSADQAVTVMALRHLLAGQPPRGDSRLSEDQLRVELGRRYGAVPAVARWLGA